MYLLISVISIIYILQVTTVSSLYTGICTCLSCPSVFNCATADKTCILNHGVADSKCRDKNYSSYSCSNLYCDTLSTDALSCDSYCTEFSCLDSVWQCDTSTSTDTGVCQCAGCTGLTSCSDANARCENDYGHIDTTCESGVSTDYSCTSLECSSNNQVDITNCKVRTKYFEPQHNIFPIYSHFPYILF